MSDKKPVNISKELYNKIAERVKEAKEEFKSVDEYVEFVLREVVKEEKPEEVYSPEDEELIKKRLKDLGYL